MRYKYDPLWKYVTIYDSNYNELITFNNIETLEEAKALVYCYYEEYIKIKAESKYAVF